MKFLLVVVLSVGISLSASAQLSDLFNISFKKHVRYPQIALKQNHPFKNFPAMALAKPKLPKNISLEGEYDIELQESAIMKVAQHNMRFRIYDIASYNFSDLAKLYIKEKRFSEAMWFLLQSNNISRQQNNDRLTLSNLMDLAIVKANMGDPVKAQEDLAEAQQLAQLKGLLANISDIQKELKFVQQFKPVLTKAEWRYAADALITPNKKVD
ncbi:hypothetical protein [Mucilaginibacter sp.]